MLPWGPLRQDFISDGTKLLETRGKSDLRLPSSQICTRLTTGKPVLTIRAARTGTSPHVIAVLFGPSRLVRDPRVEYAGAYRKVPGVGVSSASTLAAIARLAMVATDPTRSTADIIFHGQQQVSVLVMDGHKDASGGRAIGATRTVSAAGRVSRIPDGRRGYSNRLLSALGAVVSVFTTPVLGRISPIAPAASRLAVFSSAPGSPIPALCLQKHLLVPGNLPFLPGLGSFPSNLHNATFFLSVC